MKKYEIGEYVTIRVKDTDETVLVQVTGVFLSDFLNVNYSGVSKDGTKYRFSKEDVMIVRDNLFTELNSLLFSIDGTLSTTLNPEDTLLKRFNELKKVCKDIINKYDESLKGNN